MENKEQKTHSWQKKTAYVLARVTLIASVWMWGALTYVGWQTRHDGMMWFGFGVLAWWVFWFFLEAVAEVGRWGKED